MQPQVKASWQEEADRKRLEVVQKCLEAPPVQLSEQELERIAEAKAAPPRGRGGADAMDTGGANAGAGGKQRKGKGRKVKKGVVVGNKKGRKKQVGVLSKVSGEQRIAGVGVGWGQQAEDLGAAQRVEGRKLACQLQA